jgi:signal recognition particle receptor subunit beta
MVVINYSGEEINAKIVYYGPGLSGKTTNLEFIYSKMPTEVKGKMVSMKTRTDRTLFFDFLPIELGDISGYRTRFLLYTVPGQVYYNATRKLVLKGVDAVVFVADSSRSKLNENLESLRNLEENLNEHDLTLDTIPWVIQYNKRDAEDAMSIEELDEQMNLLKVSSFEAVATDGSGIYETFQGIARLLYLELKKRFEGSEAAEGQTAPVKKFPGRDETKESMHVSAADSDDAQEVELTSPVQSSSPPTLPPCAEEQTGDSPLPSETQETVSSVVDQALREIDSSPAEESTEDTTADSQMESKFEGDEYHFAPIDGIDGMENDLGRVLELDETPKPIEREEDITGDSNGNGFIKDPCRTTDVEDNPCDDKVEKVQVEIEAVHDPVHETPPPSESVLTLPIVISRSQVRKTIPLKLVLEVQITDDEQSSS